MYGQENNNICYPESICAFHICLCLHSAVMGAWRTLLLLWNKTDSGCEVRRICFLERKRFLDKVPKLDRGWAMCYKAMSKELVLACVFPSPCQKPDNWEAKSLSRIWTRSQPSQMHKKVCFAVSPTEMKCRKTGLSVDTFLLICRLPVVVRPIHGWAGTMLWSQLIYPHFASLQFTIYKAV